ncbi:pentapeptide repeat-containing protein [Polyangium sp. y55x31]|uniref:pentapeptide repeat-containing protein n=1 Tax=Polyangium sp. y55x31 TaxID=3042688 RepID=UPI002483190C|nr:pentapeptide repeat-containing protein [Polyangium sp. y55x31]MDI1484828.1 pentapeptide repeat-containing protein [Polyangium sp. y55x31]
MAKRRPSASRYLPPQSAEELLARYARGERRFPRAELHGADLTVAKLSGADLSRAKLSGAKLSDAKLSDAKLRGADLAEADLTSADLTGADLADAILISATLTDAKLGGADLSRADLYAANLCSADIRNTRFDGARLGMTIFADVDLFQLCNADPPPVCELASFIDYHSMFASVHIPASRLENFLIRAGIPSAAAQYMINAATVVRGSDWNMMRSTFVSYGSPDERFARKLYEALHRNRVRVFLFSEHAEPGEKSTG